MKELKAWAEKASSDSFPDRVSVMNAVLTNFAYKSREAEKIADAVSDQKEFRKLSYLTHLHYIPMDKTKKDSAELLSFNRPMVAVNHKKLPLILSVSDRTIPSSLAHPIKDMEKSFSIKQNLKWIKAVSHMNREEKEKLKDLILEGIETYRVRKNINETWLSDFIRSEKDFKIVGFAINIPYINIDKKWGDTKPLWMHPWATPQLLLKHKRLPCIMIVGPSIRLNENVMGDKSMEGYTG